MTLWPALLLLAVLLVVAATDHAGRSLRSRLPFVGAWMATYFLLLLPWAHGFNWLAGHVPFLRDTVSRLTVRDELVMAGIPVFLAACNQSRWMRRRRSLDMQPV